jgi:hypothetical protein
MFEKEMLKRHWPIFMVLGLVTSCTDPAASPLAPEQRAQPITGRSSAVPTTSTTAMDPALRAAEIATIQADADAIYSAERDASGAARFVHSAQRFEATIDTSSVRVRSMESNGWDLSLRTTGIGCEGNVEKNFTKNAGKISGNRVEISKGNVREWYVNGPLGLEQGFTLLKAPSCPGTKIVTIAVDGSVVAKVVDEDKLGRGRAAAFMNAQGAVVARYTDLFVKDATGRRVPAWLSSAEGGFSLHVDDASAEYPLVIDPLVAVEQSKLVTSDGAAGDLVGTSVAVSGDTALVGAPRATIGGVVQGAVYVFNRNGGVWTEQQKFTASGSLNFGGAVALSGDIALVGARNGNGGAYVFVRSGGVWAEQQKLYGSDLIGDEQFGSAVAVFGDTAIVGAGRANFITGAAYVFTQSNGVWTEQQKLTASDGAGADYFAESAISLVGDTALIGAYGNIGSAYVFTRSMGVWTETQKLNGSDSVSKVFGYAVALSTDTALVGAYTTPIGGQPAVGAAYVFTPVMGVWTETQKLTASDGAASDLFGISVALAGDTALVGTYQTDIGANADQGSAYVFTRNMGTWTEQVKVTASDGAAGDFFAYAVALDGNTALVGARRDGIGGNVFQGSAYVFALGYGNGDTCTTATQCASGSCVDGVCCDAVCGDGDLSDCQACSVAMGAAVNGVCGPVVTGIECRASAGACDVAETCDGVSNTCPADALAMAGVKCRVSVAECDAVETCDGSAMDCPVDDSLPNGSPCTGGRCLEGVCTNGGSSSSSSSGAGGSESSSGSGGTGGRGDPRETGSCACRYAGQSEETSPFFAGIAGIVLGARIMTRRRRSRLRAQTSR